MQYNVKSILFHIEKGPIYRDRKKYFTFQYSDGRFVLSRYCFPYRKPVCRAEFNTTWVYRQRNVSIPPCNNGGGHFIYSERDKNKGSQILCKPQSVGYWTNEASDLLSSAVTIWKLSGKERIFLLKSAVKDFERFSNFKYFAEFVEMGCQKT